MSDDLHVVSARLHALAAAQQLAGHRLTTATALPEPTPAAVDVTHGPAASATVGALVAVKAARAEAGLRMAVVSQGMSERLRDSAARYDHTDRAAADFLEQQLPGVQ
ncbi:uncharacterized protein RMCC_4491 [Mycolicibacterium canariasense]|uniref:ESX-1 secretion-associated protein n=1 Tax=Mycolicibacterium canariasense TaxID=228230 RepID=A0A100WG66_MYCCR|nr:type VII secretion target [Mycolicibacterium canariasense]MCV7210708.1 ESX-1 secretion-associated protein [Mycolicibacterium canariasense]ORU98306.1 hypothetical protein AWB94_28630 [Mycolicibacterium canariasense]GAS97525.1 uncharacterized protein RMCC_4491 [Mycolicibacterium canariasense]